MLLTIVGNRVERGRVEQLNGENYTVYPVIMLTVGVHSGSGGPTLYTDEELSSFASAWNGVPVTLQHPDQDGVPVSANSPEIYESQVLGTLFNTVYENGKLKGEIWLNNDLLNDLDPGLRGRLLSGEKLEVSTGLFCEDDQTSGTFNNEEYNSIARNIRPDHLALLPDSQGACSWADGCGVRANENEEGGMIRKKKIKINTDVEKQNEKYFINNEEFTINELDYTKIVSMMHDKIDSMDIRGEKVNYLRRVFPNYVIYSVHYSSSDEPTKTIKRNYRITNDTVEWAGDPIQVTETVSYTEINNNVATNEEEDMVDEKVKTMAECCPDKVDELIKNNSNFTEEHKASLLGMSEDQFALTIDVAKDVKIVDNVDDLVDNKDDATLTDDEILKNASPELKESIAYGKKALATNKANLINKIKENKSNQFSDDELKGFDIDMLERLSKMTPEPIQNYSLNNGAPIAQGSEVPEPLPKTNIWEEEKK